MAGLTDTYVAADFVAGHTLSLATISVNVHGTTVAAYIVAGDNNYVPIIMCRWATTCAVKPGAERLRIQSPATKYASTKVH